MAERSFDPVAPSSRPLAAAIVAVALVAVVAGCSAKKTAPPRPPLPAVVFVEPCDPQAAIGMTEAGVAQLRTRDEAWRQHVEILEAIIREDD